MNRFVAIALLSLPSAAAAGSVVGSKHDFSTKGPGPYRAVSESDACIFCHIAHGAGPSVLSNLPDTATEHRPYESSTMTAQPGTPSGSSRLCLSCHDGTIAMGQTRKGFIRMESGNVPIDRARRSNLGTDLRRSHPISMRTPTGKKVRAPHKADAVRLDKSASVQCTSCHDPHDEWRDPDVGKFLVKRSARSALCLSCHADIGGGSATHLLSMALQTDAVTGATRPMAEVGCGACHVPHGADARGRLLKEGVSDDDVCLGCHGKTTEKLISSDLSKAYAHTTPEKGVHDAAEGPDAPTGRKLPETSPGAHRHATCADCHNPHASTAQPALAPNAPGPLAGVWGIDLEGRPVTTARYEYEVCLKCHGDSANKPQASTFGGPSRVRRAQPDVNLRLVFARDAASSHPVAAPGKNPVVPSLKAPLSPAAVIFCTDCHASDTGPGAGGDGARGPHGSVHPFLLERQYLTDDLTPEGPGSYALCYKCHDREILLSDRSTFPPHRRHVVEHSTPCSACHAAHGVSRNAGTERNNAHLISFDLSIVRSSGRGAPPRYDSLAPGRGSCTLSCHGIEHGSGSPASSY